MTTKAYPAFFAARSARPSLGARAASNVMTSLTCRHAVAVETPNPAATSANVSALRR